MNYQQISTTLKDNILTLTLNRPEKLNAFTRVMMNEMIDVFERANADDEVRAIVVTGAGRAFCAGADLSAGADTFNRSRTELDREAEIDLSDERFRDGGGRLTLAVYECLKPVIAAVNGPAVGVGATMLLAMDIRIASDDARFGFVFARRGLVPEAGSAWFLPQLVGLPQALRWCLEGRMIGPDEALKAGLISEIIEPPDLLFRARAIALEIADNTAPVSVALTRQLLWRFASADGPFDLLKIDGPFVQALGSTPDVKEGVTAFLEKRPPAFPGRVSTDMPKGYPWWKEQA